MYYQSPIRTHRSKGVKVKHIVQICLLLAVCFWLIYQVKHSQEKRKEFDARDGKVVGKVHSDSDIQILGRKGHPRVTGIATDVEDEEEKESEEGAESKHVEDESEKDENIHEDEPEKDDNMHEEDEPEKDDNKHEEDEPEKDDNKHEEEEPEKDDNKHEEDEPEKDDNKHEEDEPEKEDNKEEELDEGRGGGDDEIDENEAERTDTEPEHEEESVDEDNERVSEEHHTERDEIEDLEKEHAKTEKNEDARKEEHAKTEENEDVKKDDSESNTRSDDQVHEARDAQYNADDASSEVAQNSQTLVPETGNFTVGKVSEMFGKVVNFGEGNETGTSDKDDSHIQSAVPQPREDVMNNSVSSSNATATDEIKYDIHTDKGKETPSQNSTFANDQTDNRSNSTSQSTTGKGEALEGEEGSKPELDEVGPNKTENVSNSTSHSTTGEGEALEGEERSSKPELAEVEPDKTENVNSNTTTDHLQKTYETDAMAAKEDSSLHVGEKFQNNVTSGSDDIQHDPIARSNTSALTRESKMDLGSLPKIQTEVQSNIDAAAE